MRREDDSGLMPHAYHSAASDSRQDEFPRPRRGAGKRDEYLALFLSRGISVHSTADGGVMVLIHGSRQPFSPTAPQTILPFRISRADAVGLRDRLSALVGDTDPMPSEDPPPSDEGIVGPDIDGSGTDPVDAPADGMASEPYADAG
ncbi:hypothetical protein SAMN05421774_11248 [Gemmobacter megaterium]|uniref:Uncharacterized protein n=1 Tax=Gemmobacter megaterium TaxID=1086013 RepID=A0A1N7QIF4_9RHOB|nr:hypothetical protein [Gemmobacter megaterium]GGE26648.1 hypothetical protein GCM10011345_35800 [Gemmobacter megaterium]SIT22711.1 hypothetical protein SAMN05421774_11248 [Gemmobacter megaterium]